MLQFAGSHTAVISVRADFTEKNVSVTIYWYLLNRKTVETTWSIGQITTNN